MDKEEESERVGCTHSQTRNDSSRPKWAPAISCPLRISIWSWLRKWALRSDSWGPSAAPSPRLLCEPLACSLASLRRCIIWMCDLASWNYCINYSFKQTFIDYLVWAPWENRIRLIKCLARFWAHWRCWASGILLNWRLSVKRQSKGGDPRGIVWRWLERPNPLGILSQETEGAPLCCRVTRDGSAQQPEEGKRTKWEKEFSPSSGLTITQGKHSLSSFCWGLVGAGGLAPPIPKVLILSGEGECREGDRDG